MRQEEINIGHVGGQAASMDIHKGDGPGGTALSFPRGPHIDDSDKGVLTGYINGLNRDLDAAISKVERLYSKVQSRPMSGQAPVYEKPEMDLISSANRMEENMKRLHGLLNELMDLV